VNGSGIDDWRLTIEQNGRSRHGVAIDRQKPSLACHFERSEKSLLPAQAEKKDFSLRSK